MAMFLTGAVFAAAPTLSGSYTAASCVEGCVTGSDTWNTHCSGTYAAMAHGDTATVTNTASGYTGSETATCNNAGTGAVTFSGNTCASANCPSGTTVSWGAACSQVTGSTVNNGGTIGLVQTSSSGAGYNGSCTALCTSGTLACTGTPTCTYSACFLGYVKITLADGSTKTMEELKVGDVVKGHTGNNTVKAIPVLKTSQTFYGFNGRPAMVTGGHPFWTAQGWKAIDPSLTPTEHHNVKTTKLEVGDVLTLDDGHTFTIRSIAPYQLGERDIYNPAVDGDHTYYAGHMLVHNKLSSSGCSTC